VLVIAIIIECSLRRKSIQGNFDDVAQELRDLMKRLLVHNPNQRLGALKAGAAEVKAHPWFANFDWTSFAKCQLKAPYVPQVRQRPSKYHFLP